MPQTMHWSQTESSKCSLNCLSHDLGPPFMHVGDAGAHTRHTIKWEYVDRHSKPGESREYVTETAGWNFKKEPK